MEFYRKGIEAMNGDEFHEKDYALGTLRQVRICQQLWKSYVLPLQSGEGVVLLRLTWKLSRYSEKILRRKDRKESLAHITFQVLYHFLYRLPRPKDRHQWSKETTGQVEGFLGNILLHAPPLFRDHMEKEA